MVETSRLLDYESLVVPLFDIEDTEKKAEIKRVSTREDEKKVDTMLANLNFISELIKVDMNPKWEGPSTLIFASGSFNNQSQLFFFSK